MTAATPLGIDAPDEPEHDTRPRFVMIDEAGDAPSDGADTLDADPDLPALPAAFWTARPVLAHIRDYAQARGASADPVLVAVLCRVAALVRRGTVVDTGLLVPPRLNLFGGLVGGSGRGKSTSMALADQLLPYSGEAWQVAEVDDAPEFIERGLGSGEGICEAFIGARPARTGSPGRPRMVRSQVRHNALLTADEGGYLVAALDRQGASLGPLLRAAWNSSRMGQQNGSTDTSRDVAEHCLGLIVGFQPRHVVRLFDEADLGTPQRFVWCPARTPRPTVTPSDPGPLTDWRPPAAGTVLPVPASVTATLRAQWDADLPVPPIDAQRPVMLAKLAALLAILDGRAEVTTADWALGEVIYGLSRSTWLALAAYSTERAERDRHRVREERAADAQLSRLRTANVGDDRNRVALVLVRRTAQIDVAEDRGATRRELHRSVAGRDRHLFDEALRFALGGNLIVQRDGEAGYRVGPGALR